MRHPATEIAGLVNARFTLVEVIVALIVAGMLGALVIPLLGRGLAHSGDAGMRVGDTYELMGTMEAIAEAYEANVVLGNNTLAELKGWIGADGTDMNNDYGKYRVVESKYIRFESNLEAAGMANDILKVTVQNNLGETITGLFPNPDTSAN